MPASPPPSVLPSRLSASRPADASSKFVVSEAGTAEVEGSEPTDPGVDSGSTTGESVESGEAFGAHEENATDTPLVAEGDGDEISSPSQGGAEASPESSPDSLEWSPLPHATAHSVSNPLPELEMVSQSVGQQRGIATILERKSAPLLNVPVTRIDTAVPQQGDFGLSLVQPGTGVGSSAEIIFDQAPTTPKELNSRTTPSSGFLESPERDVGPRAQELSAGDVRQSENRSAIEQTKALAGDLPLVDQGVGQDDSDATRPTRSERQEVPRPQMHVSAEEDSQRGESFKSPNRPEGGGTPPSSVDASVPVREVTGDPVRTVPQGNTPQPTKVNSPTQSLILGGGLAEAVGDGAAEEVPASVNLTRRALRSLGRGHGGATVVQLRPAQFGKVTIRVQMEEGRVQADLVVRTPEAARVLGEHLRLLRDSLEHKGLVLDRLEVREESKAESSRFDPHNEKDTGEDRPRGERDQQDSDASSKRSSSKMLGQTGVRADEFGQVLMAAEEQA